MAPSKAMLGSPTAKEARLYAKLAGGKVMCGLCERRCVIPDSGRGFCKTRINVAGKLHTLVYGSISAVSVNPIEKKPFFHYRPGSKALTFSSLSCNFSCPWCQNWELSRSSPGADVGNFVGADRMVSLALSRGCQSLSVSFNEPTLLFDYCVDLFPAARRSGLGANFVSNGYMTEEALAMLREAGMDAIKFDVKGDSGVYEDFCGGARAEVVWRNAKRAKDSGLHVEVVNLVIPGVNDDDACVDWIVGEHLKNLGPEVPLHFTRYHPTRWFGSPPTPVSALERAREVARKAGVLYAYVGNVPGHRFENTWCPACGELLVERRGFEAVRMKLSKERRCPRCGNGVPIVL
ncbi:MAG: AmmeMemoRadiSam system radical SAM enzyme [Candidatus Brockarchaeota archaeon]|nr:AmmeMemoRadiSam system radical SAM enzyme [Candidatus Brockarchaeota archaeon]